MRATLIARFCVLTAVVVGAATGFSNDAAGNKDISSAARTERKLNGRTLFLPEGFEVELAAGPPLVERPICIAFDDRGRLYVAESSGSNDPVQVQLKKRPHRILRLEDTDGDGKYDRRTVFADRMMFPEGVLWYRGSVYVAAPPSIWKLTDTDGDGVADVRQEWFLGKTLTHCANDLHGPYLGPDGRLYWCKGAFAEQRYPRFGGEVFVTRAAHIFRCPVDAPLEPSTNAVDPRYVEPVMTGGMDNPVEVVFTPEGELIFSTTFLVHPGGGLRDGLIHAIYGGVYGKDQPAIEGHRRTGELMPVLLHLGPAAACGLERYQSGVFGRSFTNNLFVCAFNLHEVFRVQLTPEGASYRATATPFFGSPDVDFHPTDVAEDADGSLLVVDTGGWYKLCCPSSQLWKPDVLGAIYRIRRRGAGGPEDPWGRAIRWQRLGPQELVRYLGDPRPMVHWQAVDRLAQAGDRAVPVLAEVLVGDAPLTARLGAIWALSRIGTAAALRQVRGVLERESPEQLTRAALHVVSLYRDEAATQRLIELLEATSPYVRRRAAEALGRIRAREAVPRLLAAAARVADRAEEHAVIYALIEIGDVTATRRGLAERNEPAVRRAALIALDQMRHSDLRPRDVLPLLFASDQALRSAARWVLSHRADWGKAAVGFLREHLTVPPSNQHSREALATLLRTFASEPAVQQFLAELFRGPGRRELKRFVLEQLAVSSARRLDASLAESLAELLEAEGAQPSGLTAAAVEVLFRAAAGGAHPRLQTALAALARRSDLPDELRLKALVATPGQLPTLDEALFEYLLQRLAPQEPVSTRALASRALTKASLTKAQVLRLTRLLPELGPLEVEQLLLVYRNWDDEQVARELLHALRSAPARTALNLQLINQRRRQYPAAMQRVLEELAKLVEAEIARRREHIVELYRSLPPGDVRRGQKVFLSSKAACSACHAIGYLGGRVGPDLTRIGRVRSKLELLEAIIDPSASIIRSYEPVLVMTKEGKVINGLIQRETAEELELVTGPNQTVTVRRADIEAMRVSNVSIMPAGLDQQLSRQELADLLEFLANCR